MSKLGYKVYKNMQKIKVIKIDCSVKVITYEHENLDAFKEC